jgi:hypothetical protein
LNSKSIETHLSFACMEWNDDITISFRELLDTYIFGTRSRIERHTQNRHRILDGSYFLSSLDQPCRRRLHVTVYVPTKQISVDAYHKIFQPHGTPVYFAVLSGMMESGFVTFHILSNNNVLHQVTPRDTVQSQKKHKR